MAGICILKLASGVMGVGHRNAGEKRMWRMANVRPQLGGEKRGKGEGTRKSPGNEKLAKGKQDTIKSRPPHQKIS